MGALARRFMGVGLAALVLAWAGAPAHGQGAAGPDMGQGALGQGSLGQGALGQGALGQGLRAPAPARDGTEDGRGRRGAAADAPQPGLPQTDAEAAGLRTAAPRRAVAEPARTRGLPAEAGLRGPATETRRSGSQPAPMANRRTGRMPRGRAPALPAQRPPAMAPAADRGAATPRPGVQDQRALDRGLAVPAPRQGRRPWDVPIVVERSVGRVLPNANPLGRNAVIDPRTGEVVSYDRRVPPEADPFAALGLRVGSFIVTPQAEVTLGYDSNPRRLNAGSAGSSFTQSYGEVAARSDWSRHEVTGRIRGTYSAYFSDPGVNRPELTATVTGRADLARDTRIETEGRYSLTATLPGSTNLPSSPDGLRNLPLTRQIGGTAGVVQDIGRLQLSLRGAVDRYTFDDAVTNAGTVLPQGERAYTNTGARLRASYELTPGFRPFVEMGLETRRFDQPVSSSGYLQGSRSTTYRVGSTLELTRLITGEISVGYLIRRNADPAFADARVPVLDAALAWTPTALTTVRFTARSMMDESYTVGGSGVERRDLTVELEHGFRRWLTGTARFAYGQDTYRGTPRLDKRMVASLGLVYRASRSLQIRGEVRREALYSNQAGQSYSANIFLVGLRLQR